MREGADVQGAATEGDRAGRIEGVIAADGEGASVDEGAAGIGVDAEEVQRTVPGLGQAAGNVGRSEGADDRRSTGATAADELQLGNRPGDVGPGIGDDDTDHLAGHRVEHRITLSRRTSRDDTI